MSARPLGVAIAGIGNAGHEPLRAFGALDWARVRAMVDLNGGRAAGVAADAGVECAIHRDLGAALADDEVDAVVIATPNSLHAAMTAAAARAGKHILLEKPAALDARSLEEMVAQVRRAGVLCQASMILRWHRCSRASWRFATPARSARSTRVAADLAQAARTAPSSIRSGSGATSSTVPRTTTPAPKVTSPRTVRRRASRSDGGPDGKRRSKPSSSL